MSEKYDLGFRVDHALCMAGGHPAPSTNVFVGIKKGLIAEVKPFKASDKAKCRKFVDKKNSLMIPGLVNAHAHLAMVLFRGLEDDTPLETWLFKRIFPLEAALVSPAFVRAGVELAARECLRFGTTTVNDMYFFTDEAAKIWDRVGLRGVFSQAFSDNKIPEDAVLKDTREERFRKLHKKYKNHSRIDIGLAPHAPYTCSDETLRQAAELAKEHDAILHIHLSEAHHEVEDSLKKFKEKPTQRLERLGVLRPKTLCAHSVHLDEDEVKILAKTGACPIYNPDSNAKLASGVAPIPLFKKHDVPVALGTDGAASNNDLSLFGAMDLGTKLQKLYHQDSQAMIAADALRMATYDGAKAMGMEDRIGSIEVGKEADLVFVDLDFPHLKPLHDTLSQMVYACQGLEVDTVVCQGKILMKDKKFTEASLRKDPQGLDGIFKRIRKHLAQLTG